MATAAIEFDSIKECINRKKWRRVFCYILRYLVTGGL